MKRRRIPEVMDNPAVEETAHAEALRSLNRVDRLLGVHRRLCRYLWTFGAASSVSVLDVGCGGGGFLEYLTRQKDPMRSAFLVGLDRSAFALKCANCWHVGGVQWISADARRIPLADDSIDVVTCSLFLHHFDAAEAVVLLHEAARVARRGMIVADLARSRLAWGVTWLMTRVLSRSWIFHVDGPRSVRAAFQAVELADVARLAGLDGVKVERRFPFRLVLTWKKTEAASGPR